MKLLQWLRLVDVHDGRLSLSAVAFGGSLALVLCAQTWVALGVFAVASAVYAHRRVYVHRGQAREEKIALMARSASEAKDLAMSAMAGQERIEQRLAAVENRPRVQGRL